MAARRGSYPHPVLDHADDVASELVVVNVAVVPTLEDVELTYDVRSDDPDLWALIEQGLARHSLRWTCSATIFTDEVTPEVVRRVPEGVMLRTSIDQQSIRGDVSAELRVVVTERLVGHRWARQHPDYQGAQFDIESGDVLADCGKITFLPDKFFDPLRPPIGSCFEFIEKSTSKKGIDISFTYDDVVKVVLPTDMFRHLGQLAAQPELQIGIVVLPALMRTLEFIKDVEADSAGEDLEGRRWYQAIMDLVSQHGSLDDSTLDLAQRILANPADRALQRAVSFDQEEDE